MYQNYRVMPITKETKPKFNTIKTIIINKT